MVVSRSWARVAMLWLALAGCSETNSISAPDAPTRLDAGRLDARRLDAGARLDALDRLDTPPDSGESDGRVDAPEPRCRGTWTLEGTPVPSPWLALAYPTARGFVEPPRAERSTYPWAELPAEGRWRWHIVSDDLETVSVGGTLAVEPLVIGGMTHEARPTGALDPTSLTTVVLFRTSAWRAAEPPVFLGLVGLEDGAPRSPPVAPVMAGFCSDLACVPEGARVLGATHDGAGFSIALVLEHTNLGTLTTLLAVDLDDGGAVLGTGSGTAVRLGASVSRCERAWCGFAGDWGATPWSFHQLVRVDRSGARYGAWTPRYDDTTGVVYVARASATGAHVWYVLGPTLRILRMNTETGTLDEFAIEIRSGERLWNVAIGPEHEGSVGLLVTFERADGTYTNRFVRAQVGAGITDEIPLEDGGGESFVYFLGDRYAIGYAGMLDEVLCD